MLLPNSGTSWSLKLPPSVTSVMIFLCCSAKSRGPTVSSPYSYIPAVGWFHGRRNQEEERKKVSQQTSRSNPKYSIWSHFGKLNEVIYLKKKYKSRACFGIFASCILILSSLTFTALYNNIVESKHHISKGLIIFSAPVFILR